MGQFQSIVHRRSRNSPHQLKSFPDLSNFPPEVAVSVLSHLNATDLCLAACVWKHFADNELLWQRFVISKTVVCVLLANLRWKARFLFDQTLYFVII